MIRKDAGRNQRAKWKVRLCLMLGALAVVAAIITARLFWGPGSASAQSSGDTTGKSVRPGNSTPPSTNSGGKIAVMAVVNGEQISRQQLAQECLRRYGEEVLESLVNKHLILDACQKRGITIAQKDIDDEVVRLARKFGLSADRWLQLLSEERGINPDQYRRDIVWPTIALRKLAANSTKVSRDEIKRMLESELGARVQVRMITVRDATKAEQLRAMAAGEPDKFPKLAKDHSEDKNTASVGGIIMPIRRHVGNPVIEKEAYALKEGQVSNVLHVANQYIILKCEKRIPPIVVSPQQRQAAETRIVEHLREKKLREIASGIFRQLQIEAQITVAQKFKKTNKQADTVGHGEPKIKQPMPGIAATINGKHITIRQLSEECIVRHGLDVLDGEINRKLLTQALRRKNVTIEKADIDGEISRAAESYGHVDAKTGTPKIKQWLEHVVKEEGATVDLYVRDVVWPSVALKKLVAGNVKVTKEDVEKGKVANYGPRVEALAIVMNNHRKANEVWNDARNNPTEEFFGKLAQQYSIEPISRENFGRVPPIQRFGGRPTIEEAAFELNPGEISGLIAIGDKWVILYCLGRTKPVVTKFDDKLVAELHKDIHEKKLRLEMAKEFDRLKETAQIDDFLAGTSQSGKESGAARTANAAARGRVPFGRKPNSPPGQSRTQRR